MQSQNQDYYYGDQDLVCPSFNTYSTEADTAAKVCREFANLGLVDEELEYEEHDQEVIQDDDDFEFVSFQRSADEVVIGENNDSTIGPVFPVFNRDLISGRDHANDEEATSSSSASSDVDELDRVPAGSYCVWMPKTTPASSPTHCKKSKSTGTSSSKKWRLRDLLRRSNSESRKDSSFVFLTPSLTSSSSSKNNNKQTAGEKMAVTSTAMTKKKMSFERRNGPNAVSMAHEVFYGAKSKDKKELGFNQRRQSFLPYKRDLVGFFASVNAMGGRTFPTF